MADAQNPNDELYPIAVLMDELKVAKPLAPRLLKTREFGAFITSATTPMPGSSPTR